MESSKYSDGVANALSSSEYNKVRWQREFRAGVMLAMWKIAGVH